MMTREEIAEILAKSRDEWQREYFKKYPVSEGTLGPLDMAAFHLTQADALLARLRPAWEELKAANGHEHVAIDGIEGLDATNCGLCNTIDDNVRLRADLNEMETRAVEAEHGEEAAKADLRACAEALADTLVPLEALHVAVGWELSPLVMGEIARTLGIGRAALARPGVQAEMKQ